MGLGVTLSGEIIGLHRSRERKDIESSRAIDQAVKLPCSWLCAPNKIGLGEQLPMPCRNAPPCDPSKYLGRCAMRAHRM